MTTPRLLLTGATDGIGRALAHALHARGVRLVAHGRSPAKLAELAAELPGIETTVADFARLADVAALAQRLLADATPLDGLIANAGVFMTERVLTADACETSFQVNHLAHLQLMLDLLPLMPAGSRITVLASTSHEKVRAVDLNNLDWATDFAGYPAYGLAKLAQVGAAMQFAPSLAERGISIQALHPGSILTKLNLTGWGGGGNPDPDEAVRRVLDLAFGPAAPTGQWWVDGQARPPNALLLDPALRAALFAKSLAIIGRAAP